MSLGKVSIALILAAALFAGCGYSDSDVLASYTDGAKTVDITRGDFYKSLNQWQRSSTLSSRPQQENALQEFVFNKLKAVEALKQGLDKDKTFQEELKKAIDSRLALSSYLKEKQPQFFTMEKENKFKLNDFSFKTHVISHLVIRVDDHKTVQLPDPDRFKKMDDARKTIKDPRQLDARLKQLADAKISKREKLTPAELQDAEQKALDKIKKAEAELKSGKAFTAVARAYGQDGTAHKGGYLGFVYPHMQRMDIPFRDAALALKAGETSGIVKGKFGYHLIKCDAIVTLDRGNIRDYFPTADERKQGEAQLAAMKKRLDTLKGKQKDDYEKQIENAEKQQKAGWERQMAQALQGFWFSHVMQYLDNLKTTDQNIKFHDEALKGEDKNAVVFEINHKDYQHKLTLGEYLDVLAKVHPMRLAQYGITREANDKKPFTFEERQKYLNWHITFALLSYSAYKSGVVEMESFKKAVDELRDQLLVKTIQDNKNKSIQVSDADLLDEYNKNKTRYMQSKRVQDGAGKWKTEQTQLSFVEAKDRVKATLEGIKRRDLLLGWKSQLLAQYKVKLYPDRFEIITPKKPRQQPPRQMPPRQMPQSQDKKKQ